MFKNSSAPQLNFTLIGVALELTIKPLKELERHLNKFIDWYNNERMLKKFNYKTPHELWVEFCKK
ncbi:IS3 family transposase [Mycoplasmopsis bovis]|uniref:IS3 family transposase n=1 Tax=Mycoplasmopsis bovis TaxID=28903 RepID=UPI00240D0DE6|nr:IS3 family transposase [Mycoplasmopsis bovis]